MLFYFYVTILLHYQTVIFTDSYGNNILDLYSKVNRLTRGQLTPDCGAYKGVNALGRDFSGIVTQVGQSVSKFKPGDEVSISSVDVDDYATAHFEL